jgi:hypothetical protein
MPTPEKFLVSAVLLHTPEPGSGGTPHHDWLVEPPAPFAPPDAGRLWTARILPEPGAWRMQGAFAVEVIAPHRPEYLTFEGEVSGGRGRVKRVDEGTVRALAWTDGLLDWEVALRGFQGRLRITRQAGGQWLARIA